MNPRPLPCKGSALPLSYPPGRKEAMGLVAHRRKQRAIKPENLEIGKG